MRDILGESPLEVEQVDMWSLLRYVAITCTPKDIAEKELTEMVPTRMHKRRVTIDCMVGNDGLPSSCNAYEPDEWALLAAEPTHQQRRRLITTAVSVGRGHRHEEPHLQAGRHLLPPSTRGTPRGPRSSPPGRGTSSARTRAPPTWRRRSRRIIPMWKKRVRAQENRDRQYLLLLLGPQETPDLSPAPRRRTC